MKKVEKLCGLNQCFPNCTLTFCYLIRGPVLAPFDLLTPDFKNVSTGQLCLHTLRHTFTPPSHQKWGLETNLSYSQLLYCWRSHLFSHLFEIARDSKMYTHISQCPENDISEIWTSSPYRQNSFPKWTVFWTKPLRSVACKT